MGIISRIMRPKAMSPRELEKLILETVGNGPTVSGMTVNDDSAMRVMAVHSCVRTRAFSIAQLPLHLYRQSGDTKEKATDHPVYRLMHDQPNAWMTAPEYFGMLSAHLDLRGNFYALKTFTTRGKLAELIPLAIGAVEGVEQISNYKLVYKVRRPGNDNILDLIPGDRIHHVRGLVLNGYLGINPIQYARESIGLAMATEKHGAKLFSNGARIGGILSHPGVLSPEKYEKIKESFNDAYASVENAHKTALLQEGMTWQAVTMTADDAQFLETRRFQKKEIVDLFFSMPLALLMADDTNPTFASAEQFGLSYVTYALTPTLVNIEKAIYRDLLTDEEKPDYYAKFSVGGLLRGDMKARFEAYQMAIDKEIMNPNEARELEDLNPYSGGEVYKTRTSTVKENGGQQK